MRPRLKGQLPILETDKVPTELCNSLVRKKVNLSEALKAGSLDTILEPSNTSISFSSARKTIVFKGG